MLMLMSLHHSWNVGIDLDRLDLESAGMGCTPSECAACFDGISEIKLVSDHTRSL